MRIVPSARLAVVCLLGAVLTGCETTPERSAADPPSRDVRNRAKVQTQLGIGYMRERQLEKALARLRTAVRTDATYAPAHNALGLLYDRLGQRAQAGTHYQRATELDPSFASAHNNYGGWLCAEERYDEAEKEFSLAVQNPLYNVPQLALFNAGLCVQKQGKTEEAIAHYQSALQKAPKFPPALYAMAELRYAGGNYLSARGYLQRFLEVADHTARSLWLGIRIERELGDKNAVSSYGMLLKSRYPDSSQTRDLLRTEQQ